MFSKALQTGKRSLRNSLMALFALGLVLSIFLTLGLDVAQAADETYTVQRGDNLTSIAGRFNVTVSDLTRANNIVNANSIYAGQVLTIPGKTAQPTTPPATTGEQGYVIQKGDSFYSIASRFGVSPYDLAAANGLSIMSYIYPGQTLRIPGKTASPVTTAPTVAPVVVKPTATPAVNQGTGAAVSAASTGKWIDVNLSQQRLTAYEGDKVVLTSRVSTGVAAHPTVTGTFSVYVKYGSQAMSGPGYYLPGVPYVMYFYSAYAIHGTYWHNNFGHPMSHGCVNMTTADAKFMYNWAPIGTPVKVHY